MHKPLSQKPPTLPRRHWTRAIVVIGLFGSMSSPAAESWGLCHRWPVPQFTPSTIPKDEAPINLFADSSLGQQNETLFLTGNVALERPNERLMADDVTYFQTQNRITASGHLRYETPDVMLEGQTAEINLDTDSGEFDTTQYYLLNSHGRGDSAKLLLLDHDVTVLKHASYTTCDPGDDAWNLHATTVTLNQATGMGSAWNTYLTFQGVPFFYFPYINFPITDARKTGILPPSIGTSRTGTDIAIPIYLNIHPQLDATITPHNYTNRGVRWINEIRYLTHYGQGKIGGEYLDDETTHTHRILNHFEHSGSFAAGWSSSVNYDRVSDKDYFSDFSSSLVTSSTSQLERHFQITRQFSAATFMAQAQDYQSVDPDTPFSARPYRRLPQVIFNASGAPKDWFHYGLDSEWVRFNQQDRLNGNRFDVSTYASLPLASAAGFLTPKLTLRHTDYRLDQDNNPPPNQKLTRDVPTFSLDSGLFFERDADMLGTSLLQTFEPEIFYVRTPYRDQSQLPLFDSADIGFSSAQLFQENRFSGRDRVGDTDQVSVALTTRFLQQDDGFERFRTTLGQIYYLQDREVALNGNVLDKSANSDAIAEAELHLSRNLSLRGDLLWDTTYDTVTRRYTRLQYQVSNRKIVNLTYREQGNRVTAPGSVTREIDAAGLWPLTPRWSIIARRYHSIPNDRTLEKLLGVEYDSCCWAFRAVRRGIFTADSLSPAGGEVRYSWYLQLELKGLTGFGNRIQTLMEETVVGYKAAQ